jgi:hypothetical protein
MINFKKVNPIYPKVIIDDIIAGKIHVVCMAQNGLTHLNVYAECYLKLPKTFINHCVELVNLKREAGTLHPAAFISILPYKKNMINGNNSPESLKLNELQNCIDDIFIANQEVLKSPIIFFTLEGSYVNKDLALRIILDKVKCLKESEVFVKEIWFEDNIRF